MFDFLNPCTTSQKLDAFFGCSRQSFPPPACMPQQRIFESGTYLYVAVMLRCVHA